MSEKYSKPLSQMYLESTCLISSKFCKYEHFTLKYVIWAA